MDQQREVSAVPMKTEDGLVGSTESGAVAVLLRKPKLAIDLPTRTAEVGAVVRDGEPVRGQGPTEVEAEAIHSAVVIRKEIILVATGAVDDAAGPGVNPPIIARVVIHHAVGRDPARASRCLVPLHGSHRIPEMHPVPSIDGRLQFLQNAKSYTLDVWSLR